MAGEQEIGKLVLRLVAEVSELKKGLQSATDSIKRHSDEGKKAATSLTGTLGAIKTQYIATAAVVYGAYKTMMKAFEWAEIGAKAVQAEQSFRALTESYKIDGQALISEMKKVGFVFVEETDLMLKAQRLLIEGISPDEIVKLTEASRVAARLMGIDVSQAFDRISEAVITLRTRGLKAAFPMDVTEITDKYARSLGTVSKYLNEAGQRQAIVNEIVRQAKEKKILIGDLYDPSQAERLERFNSALAQLREELGKVVLEFEKLATPVMEAFLKFNNFLKSLSLDPKKREEAKKWFDEQAKKGKETYDLLASHGAAYEKEKAARQAAGSKAGQIDERKLADDLMKFRLANEEQTQAALAAIRMQSLDLQRAQAIAAHKAISSDTFLIEQEFDRKVAEEELRSSLSILGVKEKAELEAARQAGMDENAVRLKFVQERYAVIQKFITDTGKLEAKMEEIRNAAMRQAVQKERGVTPEMEPFAPTEEEMAEQEKRTRDWFAQVEVWQSDYLGQLGEVEGAYDAIVSAQERSIKAEQLAFQNSELWAHLSIDQQKQYNDLIDARIQKMKEVSALENLRSIAAWRKEIGELTGNWMMTKEAEIEALEVEREYLLATQALTPEMREYINAVYDLKIAEIEAAKSMDVLALSAIGMRKYFMQTKNELVDAFQNVLPNSMKSFWDEFENYLKSGEFNFKSFADSLRSVWANLMRKMLESLVNDFLSSAIGALGKLLGLGGGGGMMSGVNVYQGASGAPGWAGFLGSILGAVGGIIGSIFKPTPTTTSQPLPEPQGGTVYTQTGGLITGPSGVDVIPVRATAGEYMQPVSAVQYYGPSVMEAIRSREIPKDRLSGFGDYAITKPIGGFQGGGMVTENSVSVGPINVKDPRLASHMRSAIEQTVTDVLKRYSR